MFLKKTNYPKIASKSLTIKDFFDSATGIASFFQPKFESLLAVFKVFSIEKIS